MPTVAVDDLPTRAALGAQGGRPSPKGHAAAGGDARDGTRSVVRPLADRDVPSFAAGPGSAYDGPSTTSPASRAAQDLSSNPPAPGAAQPSSAQPNEGSLLLRARQALDGDPATTLALTQEHARRFPAGTLAPEREVLAIEALARLGRTSEARARLDSFRSRYPQSPHISRLDALLSH
jgi:hypothetical protein